MSPDLYDFVFQKMSLSEIQQQILSRFECQKSGNCCKRDGYVYVTEENIEKMAILLNETVEEFKRNYVKYDNGWPLIAKPGYRDHCFLDRNNKCKVYSERPQHCRTYPNWPEIWESKESIIKEIKSCSGLNKYFALLSAESSCKKNIT